MDDATATVLTARHITATAKGDGITDTTTNTAASLVGIKAAEVKTKKRP